MYTFNELSIVADRDMPNYEKKKVSVHSRIVQNGSCKLIKALNINSYRFFRKLLVILSVSVQANLVIMKKLIVHIRAGRLNYDNVMGMRLIMC